MTTINPHLYTKNANMNLFSVTFMRSGLCDDESLFANKKKKIDESKYTLKEGQEIMEGIKIDQFLYNGNYSKFYLATINALEKTVILVKSFSYENEPPALLTNIQECLEKSQEISNDHLLAYFDLIINKEKKSCQILMEYLGQCVSLKSYFHKYNQTKPKNTGLPMKQIKIIIRGILDALKNLYEKGIYPGNLEPNNILVSSDLLIIKLINYAFSTYSEEMFANPFYRASKQLFHNYTKGFEYENDIWSLGCIVFELFCGYPPYYKFSAQEAACSLAQYISPLEAASEDVKDIFYDKKNRVVLDFLNQCFRNNEGTRPVPDELLSHKLLQNN